MPFTSHLANCGLPPRQDVNSKARFASRCLGSDNRHGDFDERPILQARGIEPLRSVEELRLHQDSLILSAETLLSTTSLLASSVSAFCWPSSSSGSPDRQLLLPMKSFLATLLVSGVAAETFGGMNVRHAEACMTNAGPTSVDRHAPLALCTCCKQIHAVTGFHCTS